MGITTIRRICQVYFLILFFWLCTVMHLGDRWWQLRGWPVNWLLQLDPLAGLGTLLTTRTLYSGLIWGVVTLVLTLFLGRFFCGWVCPFGTLHQSVGYLVHRKKSPAAKAVLNRYRRWQSAKYLILTVLLAGAATDLFVDAARLPRTEPRLFLAVIAAGCMAAAWISLRSAVRERSRKPVLLLATLLGAWIVSALLFRRPSATAAALLTGLLDPLPLFHRSANLLLMPLADGGMGILSAQPRYYAGAGLIGAVFLSAVLLNIRIPRFYCRFICPLGALFGVVNRWAPWRIVKTRSACRECHLCQAHCEGACDPAVQIRTAECTLCLNCLDRCPHGVLGYGTEPAVDGEITAPDLSRRGFVVGCFSGLSAIPMIRLDAGLGSNWDPALVRPPGALAEPEFLHRCIKCGQCMRICPTNVLQPATWSAGLERLWTPVLDFRIGSSGCQLNCIACGHVCPTAAIRPLTLPERLGTGPWADAGPVRIGCAFVDRGRCLPWAMDLPCIVCQENCPVSPKAITTRETFAPLSTPPLTVSAAGTNHVTLTADMLVPDRYGTGDYYIRAIADGDASALRRVLTNTAQGLTLSEKRPQDATWEPGTRLELLIRLQRPVVEPGRCIGCGVCQHECPVKGKRAIRVTADNESRNRDHALLLTP